MTRIAVAILALLAGLLTVPLVAQPAVADTGCPTASASYAGGAGTAASPWQISTAGDLQKLRDDSITGWDDSFILTANIDMGGCTWTKTIGNGTRAFTGLLDGGGHTVSGLTVTVDETLTSSYAGLVGLLASPGKVTRIGFTGAVSSSATTGSSKSAYAGGLVGYAQFGSTVSYSYATGAVTAYVSLGSMMSSAYGYAGGLLGRLDGTVSDSYATGSASATGGFGERYMYAGGLIGYFTASASRTYSTGAPTAGAGFVSQAGGFVGQTNGGTLSNSLWDVTTSGKSNGAGPNTPAGLAGKTTAQMQQFSTYDDSTWPITNGWTAFNAPTAVWGICSGSSRAFLLWQYSASPCVSAPGGTTITSVTPDQTSAQIAFTVDDTGGSPLTRIEFALDDTSAVDDSTATTSSPYVLTGLQPSTAYTVFLRAVNPQGPGAWSTATSFTTLAPPVPVPASPPQGVAAVAGDASVQATWTAPASPGSFPVSMYQATASPGGQSCLTSATTCTFTGLTNGVSYTVSVKALTGAGWSPSSAPSNAVTPRREEAPSLTITGSRGQDRAIIRISGSSKGLTGERVTMWLAFKGQEATPSVTTALVGTDGTFAWSRRTSREVRIYAQVGATRSNAITIPAR